MGILASRNIPAVDNPPDWFGKVFRWYACSTPSASEADAGRGTRYSGPGPALGDCEIIAGAGSTFRKAPLLDALGKGYRFFNDARRARDIAGEDLELSLLLESLGYCWAYDPRITLRHHIDPERLSWKAARRLGRGIGAGMLGIDPFYLTVPQAMASRVSRWRNTWQWQALSKAKRLLRHHSAALVKLAAGQHVGDVALLRAEVDWGVAAADPAGTGTLYRAPPPRGLRHMDRTQETLKCRRKTTSSRS